MRNEQTPLISTMYSKPTMFQFFFHTIGYVSEVFFSMIFWNVPVRFVRDMYFYSLSVTGFNPGSLQFLGFTIPPFALLLLLPLKPTKWLTPVFYFASYISFSLSAIEQPIIVRTIFQMLCCVFVFIWFDLRLQSEHIAVRKRFIQSQCISLLVSASFRFCTISYIPFYYRWYFALFYIVFGLLFCIWGTVEHIYSLVKSESMEYLNHLYLEFEFTLIKKHDRRKRGMGDEKDDSDCRNCARFIISCISVFFWALGFSVVVYLCQRYVSSPVSISMWAGYPFSYSILCLVAFFIGMVISQIGVSQTPLFFLLISFPSMMIFALAEDDQLTLITFGLIMVATLPSLLEFYLYEYKFIFGQMRGGVSCSSVFYIVLLLSGCAVVLYHFLQPFGTIFGMNSYLIFVVSISCLVISYISFIINRFYVIFRSAKKENEQRGSTGGGGGGAKDERLSMRTVLRKSFLVFLFPQYFSRDKLRAFVRAKTSFVEVHPHDTDEERMTTVYHSTTTSNNNNNGSGSNNVKVEVAAGRSSFSGSKMEDYELEHEEELDDELSRSIRTLPRLERLKINFSRLTQIEPCNIVLKLTMLVITLFCICLVFPSYFAHGNAKDIVPYSSDYLRMASFNIYQGYTIAGDNNGPLIADFLREKRIDFIGLQETNTAQIYNGYQSIIDFLGISSSMFYYNGLNGITPSIGAAVMSKHRILESKSETFPLLKGEGLLRPMITSEIVFNFTVVYTKTVHLDFDDMANNEVQIIVDQCKHIPPDVPVVVLGDFNSVPNSTAYNIMTDNGFRDAYYEFHGHYNATHHNGKTIDYVFVRGMNLDVVNAEIVVHDMSDHYAVIVDLEIT